MFARTADQELFEKTTARYLESKYPSDHVRDLARMPSAFNPEAWQQGAALGWTSLLVPEAAGGGSISGNGLLDLLTVAYQFGRHAAPGPLLPTNLVAAALARWGSEDQQREPLSGLIDGSATAAWCGPQRIDDPCGRGTDVSAQTSGAELILSGRLSPVEGASDASLLLVSVTEPSGRSYVLVPLPAPGVQCTPLTSIDLTRRFHDVTLRDVRLPVSARVGQAGAGDTYEEIMFDVLATLRAAELVGALQRCFDMTLQWTRDRYSFGRPLASYQEIKHRMADMRTALEAGAAITLRAARAFGDGAPDASVWCSAAVTYVGRAALEAIQDCIQIHGGIGLTAEHDLHLFLRRAVVDTQLGGSPADMTQRVVHLLETAQGARG